MEAALVPARLTHVNPLALNMRAIDRTECEALGRSPKEALRGGLRCSLEAWTALNGNKPLAMLGVVPVSLLGGRGVVWMLGSEEVFRYGRQLVRQGPGIIARWLETFDCLENVVAVENGQAIRLLQCWGAAVGSDVETHGGVEFVRFRFDRAAIQGAMAVA